MILRNVKGQEGPTENKLTNLSISKFKINFVSLKKLKSSFVV